MIIQSVRVKNDGFVACKSNFYAAHDSLSSDVNFSFSTGINKLVGEIDSGVWAVSYLLSMYQHRREDFVLFEKPEVIVNDEVLCLNDLLQYTCYMDKLHPLFSTKHSIKKLVSQGIKKNKLSYTPEEIRDLFHMDCERFERPFSGVGNEMFKAMAAIGYVNGKQIFCFPWLSQKRFKDYHGHMTDVLDILQSLEKIVVLPIGNNTKPE